MTTMLTVRVQPGARRSALIGRAPGGEWRLAVTAPPEDGRANDAVVQLLADLLGLKRRQVEVARGHASRNKTIAVEGLEAEAIAARLQTHLGDDAHGE